jgi:hypothetical protein
MHAYERCTPMRWPPMGDAPERYAYEMAPMRDAPERYAYEMAPMRDAPMRDAPMRDMPMRWPMEETRL